MIQPAFAARVYWRETFEVGQLICHKNAFDLGLITFFKATQYDVDEYSGKNGLYAVMIPSSPIKTTS